jgi:hypothetical protein
VQACLDIQAGVGSEHHPVGVQQKNIRPLDGRPECPVYTGGAAPGHAADDVGIAAVAWTCESGALARADIKGTEAVKKIAAGRIAQCVGDQVGCGVPSTVPGPIEPGVCPRLLSKLTPCAAKAVAPTAWINMGKRQASKISLVFKECLGSAMGITVHERFLSTTSVPKQGFSVFLYSCFENSPTGTA